MTKNLILNEIHSLNESKDNSAYIGKFAFKNMSLINSNQVLDYHWNDNNKKENDFYYIKKIRVEISNEIYQKLNKIHGINFSNKQWEIFFGRWLNQFLVFLFDKWEQVASIASHNSDFNCEIVNCDDSILASLNSQEFDQNINDPMWNYIVCSRIILERKNDFSSIEIKSISNKFFQKKSQEYNTNRLTDYLWKINKDRHVVINSGLTKAYEASLNMRLFQVPKMLFPNPKLKNISVDEEIRSIKLFQDADDKFISFLGDVLFKFIPKIYLENFNDLSKKIHKYHYKKNIKTVFTSYLHFQHDAFKLWVANLLPSGTKLILGQHGGQIHKFNDDYYYEDQIADYLLKWGVSDTFKTQKFVVGDIKGFYKKGKKIFNSKDGGVTLVATNMPKYTHMLRPMVLGDQVIDYNFDNIKFCKALNSNIQKKLKIRLYPQDWKWGTKNLLKNNIDYVSFDNNKSIYKSLASSRIAVTTYNGTTYIEFLAYNYPSIFFWDEDIWRIPNIYKDDFEILADAKIFHKTPISAAKHINDIWDDVDGWWYSKKVQKARKHFLSKHLQEKNQLLERLKKFLLHIENDFS